MLCRRSLVALLHHRFLRRSQDAFCITTIGHPTLMPLPPIESRSKWRCPVLICTFEIDAYGCLIYLDIRICISFYVAQRWDPKSQQLRIQPCPWPCWSPATLRRKSCSPLLGEGLRLPGPWLKAAPQRRSAASSGAKK